MSKSFLRKETFIRHELVQDNRKQIVNRFCKEANIPTNISTKFFSPKKRKYDCLEKFYIYIKTLFSRIYLMTHYFHCQINKFIAHFGDKSPYFSACAVLQLVNDVWYWMLTNKLRPVFLTRNFLIPICFMFYLHILC